MTLKNFFALGVAASLTVSAVSGAQTTSPWRFAASIGLPATVLTSGNLHIKLGLGEAFEAGRVFSGRGTTKGVLVARLYTAGVEGSGAGSKWNPGRAFIGDLSVRVDHDIPRVLEYFIGAGVSHWSGPSETAPFEEASSVLFAAEAGAARTLAPRWKILVTAHATRFGPDEVHEVESGTVIRFMLGVRYDY